MDNATKEKQMVSNTYIPGTTTAFIMNHIEADQRNKKVQEEEKDAWMDNDVVKIGLSNGCTTNKLYKDLLIDLELSSIDNSTICKIYLDWIYGYHRNNITIKKSEYNYHLLTKDIDPLFKQAIVKRNEQGSGVQEISSLF